MSQIAQLLELSKGNIPTVLQWSFIVIIMLMLTSRASSELLKLFRNFGHPIMRKSLKAIGRALNALFIALIEAVIPERPSPLPRWFDRTIRDLADLSIVLCASLTAISMGIMTIQIFIGLAVHPEQPFPGRIAAMGFVALFLWLSLFVAKMAADHGRSLWQRGLAPKL